MQEDIINKFTGTISTFLGFVRTGNDGDATAVKSTPAPGIPITSENSKTAVQGAEIPGIVPALGLTIELADIAVADDLDRAINAIVVIADLQATKTGIGPVVTKTAMHGKIAYRVTDLGSALAKRTGKNSLKTLRISYGTIGSWFTITTHDRLFNDCIDAHEKPDQFSISTAPDFVATSRLETVKPLATLIIRTKTLAANLRDASWFFADLITVPNDDNASSSTTSPAPHFTEQYNNFCDLLEHFKLATLELWAEQADFLRGRMVLTQE